MFLSEEIAKLFLALVAGGLIGAEREFRHRAAGFRTFIFVCLGSTLFTMFSLELGGETSPVRIAAHMVTGVGFLCAGVILEKKAQIVGLTTASTIWFTAALGMGIGGGQYKIVVTALVGAMIILWLFPKVEEWIYNVREMRTYKIVCETKKNGLQELESLFQDYGVRVKGHKVAREGNEIAYTIEAYAGPDDHERLIKKLLTETDIKGFQY
ncbi:MAG: MgtC/SapB family protein [Chloroflexi bacterium]|nr:MgtC/SapB family protein [Chloroflexota bacterium]